MFLLLLWTGACRLGRNSKFLFKVITKRIRVILKVNNKEERTTSRESLASILNLKKFSAVVLVFWMLTWDTVMFLKWLLYSIYLFKEIMETLHLFFYKQLGSGLRLQSCLYFQGFLGSKSFNGCLIKQLLSVRNLIIFKIQSWYL